MQLGKEEQTEQNTILQGKEGPMDKAIPWREEVLKMIQGRGWKKS